MCTYCIAAAVVWKLGEAVKVEEITVDPPKSTEIRIKMLCASICHTDLLYCYGSPIVIFHSFLIVTWFCFLILTGIATYILNIPLCIHMLLNSKEALTINISFMEFHYSSPCFPGYLDTKESGKSFKWRDTNIEYIHIIPSLTLPVPFCGLFEYVVLLRVLGTQSHTSRKEIP